MTASAAQKVIRIALAGNPNTGKTTLFNALCGTKQKTGNYPGVTVERKAGVFQEGDTEFSIVDLPGLYSLRPSAPDERISAGILTGHQGDMPVPDLVLFVLDAANLQRNLYLLTQITELDLPVAVILTMTDLLADRGIGLDADALRRSLGLPLLEINAREAIHTDRLRKAVADVARDARSLARPILTRLPAKLESIVDRLQAHHDERGHHLSRFEALNIVFYPRETEQWLRDSGHSTDLLQTAHALAAEAHDHGYSSPGILTQARYRVAEEIRSKCETRTLTRRMTRTDRIDRLLTHRVFGLAAFALIMGLVFQSIYTGAAPLMALLEGFFSHLGDSVGALPGLSPVVRSLLVDGAIAGVGSVIVFLPQIAILFAIIAFLEDSGYLARASFLMDRLLGWTGLNGRSFIPLLSSFACAIPGILSARVIADEKARKATILVSPLVSCSARLPVYVLFIGAFIEPAYGALAAAASLFFMHIIGITLALPAAWVLNRRILRTPDMPFIMEMPPYHLPLPRNIALRVREAVWNFVKRAGSTIFAFSIVIWAMSYFPRNEAAILASVEPMAQTLAALRLRASEPTDTESAEERSRAIVRLEKRMERSKAAFALEHSYLGMLGRGLQPIFAPLGFDWRLSIGIVSAFPAREVIVATLGIIHNAENESGENDTGRSLARATDASGRRLYTPLTAITLMVFFALCAQCMSTLIVIRKELGSWLYPAGVFAWMTGLAYLLALAVNQGGRLLFGP